MISAAVQPLRVVGNWGVGPSGCHTGYPDLDWPAAPCSEAFLHQAASANPGGQTVSLTIEEKFR